MKKQLLILLLPILLFSACKKTESASVPIPNKSGYVIYVKKNVVLSTGQLVANDATAAVIYVWKADGKDFVINSVTDAIGGYAYDNTTKTSIKANYSYVSKSSANENVDPGKYFVFVILNNNQGFAGGNLANSSTTFTVPNADVVTVKKIFSSVTPDASTQAWDTNN